MPTITNGRGLAVEAVTLHFASGATKVAARSLVDPPRKEMRVEGLDPDGRIVVRHYPEEPDGGWLFALTLCCNASDKGTETGIVCRGCFSDAEVGDYDPCLQDLYTRWDWG